jgi:hypothetical protein
VSVQPSWGLFLQRPLCLDNTASELYECVGFIRKHTVFNCLLGMESEMPTSVWTSKLKEEIPFNLRPLFASEALIQNPSVLVDLEVIHGGSIARGRICLAASYSPQRWFRATCNGLHFDGGWGFGDGLKKGRCGYLDDLYGVIQRHGTEPWSSCCNWKSS